MAINPNTNFTAGQVLTADQANRWPRGVMAYVVKTTDSALTTAETVWLTATFTAVANRYYKITYFEGDVGSNNTGGAIAVLRSGTTTAGTELQFSREQADSGTSVSINSTVLATFAAGTANVVATLRLTVGTGTASHSATRPAVLIVEDVGPA